MVSSGPQRFTDKEYLALEAVSETKHEFVEGEIISMAGARPPHNALTVNVSALLLLPARKHGCLTMSSDQRVHIPKTGLYVYPDVIVACGERKYTDENPPSLLNPTVVVEITSKSTEDFDRGTKFLHYQAISSLTTYVIVSHRERRIDCYRKLSDGGWHLETATEGSAQLGDLGPLAVEDVYATVDLTEGAA